MYPWGIYPKTVVTRTQELKKRREKDKQTIRCLLPFRACVRAQVQRNTLGRAPYVLAYRRDFESGLAPYSSFLALMSVNKQLCPSRYPSLPPFFFFFFFLSSFFPPSLVIVLMIRVLVMMRLLSRKSPSAKQSLDELYHPTRGRGSTVSNKSRPPLLC